MDIVSLLDTLLTSIFKAEEDFLKNPKEFSNLETSVKSSTEAFAAGFLGAILSELDQAIRKSVWREQHYVVHRNDISTLVNSRFSALHTVGMNKKTHRINMKMYFNFFLTKITFHIIHA